jgi:hypothetical protein
MKKHPDYRKACLQSTYFNPNGRESLLAVNERWGYPVKQPTLYQHMKRHQKKDIDTAEELNRISGTQSAVWQRTAGNRGLKKEELENTVEIVETTRTSDQEHEVGLDEFIAMGRAKLRTQDMSISAANYLTAIKIKAEIEKTTKDRRLELLRSMFTGAAPKEDGG